MNISFSSFTGSINGPAVVSPAVNHALICLHGFGSSGDDLIQLAAPLKATLGNLAETLAIYSPHAPATTPDGFGRQWFRDMGWTFRDAQGLASLVPQLDSFIAQIAATHGIPTTRIALLGFSQGGMTLLHCLPQLQHQPGAVITCCGAVSVAPTFPATQTAQPPLLILHGEDDDVLPADASVEAAATYRAHGYPVTLEILPHLGHGIDAATLAHISVFLQTLWQPDL